LKRHVTIEEYQLLDTELEKLNLSPQPNMDNDPDLIVLKRKSTVEFEPSENQF